MHARMTALEELRGDPLLVLEAGLPQLS